MINIPHENAQILLSDICSIVCPCCLEDTIASLLARYNLDNTLPWLDIATGLFLGTPSERRLSVILATASTHHQNLIASRPPASL